MARLARIHLQSEATECGLACLAMVADFHGHRVDLREMRSRFPVSLKGTTLAQLMRNADGLGFATRALRCEPEELSRLAVPCVLHWNLDHFVVLERVGRRGATLVDPAVGRRRIAWADVSARFSGVALELAPTERFVVADARRRLRLRDLTGRVAGLRRALAHIVAIAIALEAIALLVPLITQFVVDAALVSGDQDLLFLCASGGAALLVVDFVLRMCRGWMTTGLQVAVATQWTTNLFSHLLALPLAFFERRHLGDLASRFASLTALRTTMTSGAVTALLDGVMAFVTWSLMAVYSLPLAGIALGVLSLYIGVRWATFGSLRRASEDRVVAAARESSFFLETVRAVLPLKLHGRRAERLAEWQNLLVESQNRDVAHQRMTLWFASSSTCITALEGMLALFVGGNAVLDRSMSLGMLLAYLAYRAQFGMRAMRLVDTAVEMASLRLHAERVADIALEPPEELSASRHDDVPLEPRLEVHDLSFRYAPGDAWVVRRCSFAIESGECVAIVGVSGSGKSTLLKLMLGLHEATEGEIRMGRRGAAIDVRRLGLARYRRFVGAVMQDDALLSGSLSANIACFDVRADPLAVERAARLAAIHDEIVAMPMGYQTLVGDLGSSLSGGQKQRVLLARALYRRPSILALDEATSHLDLDNERRVNAAIRALSMTRITIAHRPETIAAADRVLVFHDGRIVRDERRRGVASPCTPAVAGDPCAVGRVAATARA